MDTLKLCAIHVSDLDKTFPDQMLREKKYKSLKAWLSSSILHLPHRGKQMIDVKKKLEKNVEKFQNKNWVDSTTASCVVSLIKSADGCKKIGTMVHQVLRKV